MPKHILAIMAVALLLTACHKDKHEDKPIATQSVLVYIAGDNNLYSFINDDVAQIMEGSKQLGNDCNLLLFVDAAKELPYFMKVEKGDTVRLKTFDQELKSSDAETLATALQWMRQNYEAKSYGLVLWGHADGWVIWQPATSRQPHRSYGQDRTGGEQWMNIPDMARAIERTMGGQRLRFIFADCCCFQSVESDYELRQAADYIIASAAEIPGEGAPYDTVLPALFSQRDDFARQAADAYFEQLSGGYREPMSVVKTSEMERLADATRTVLKQSLPRIEGSEGYPNVEELIYYYDQTLFDMQDFILRIASPENYAQWKSVFDAAVPHRTMAPVWMANHVPYISYWATDTFRDFEVTEERYGGVNMFVPQNSNAKLKLQQNERIGQMQWYRAAGLDELGW